MLHKNNPQSFFLEAKKSLGQNFLKDQGVVTKIVDNIAALIEKNSQKIVHEIGPGSGALTKPLLQRGMKVVGFEKDARAIEGLTQTLGLEFKEQLSLIETDILKHTPTHSIQDEKPICVGNIPYYITSDILLWLCHHKQLYSHGIFMVQDEVADRLQAKAGTKEYSRLSVKMQLNFTVKKLFVVPPECFVPAPKVHSAIVQLTPINEFSLENVEEKSFETFCALLFSARRKMLRRVLYTYLHSVDESVAHEFWQTLLPYGVKEDTRPDAVAPRSILELFYSVNKFLK